MDLFQTLPSFALRFVLALLQGDQSRVHQKANIHFEKKPNLVQDWDNLQSTFFGIMENGDRLSLNSLTSVDLEQTEQTVRRRAARRTQEVARTRRTAP